MIIINGHTIEISSWRSDGIALARCKKCGPIGHANRNYAGLRPDEIQAWCDGDATDQTRNMRVTTLPEAAAAIERKHSQDLMESLGSSTVLNDEPTAVPEHEQPTLDDEALIAQAILACANQIITAIDTAADQAFPHRRGRRDLAQVRILNATGAMLQQLARERGVQIARSQRASQAAVARALGVTRARVNQMLKETS